jgi:fatty-acyl-CoA synthase
MAPLAFLSRPAAWIEAISFFRGTLTVAPNFAYSLCARRQDMLPHAELDLSCLRVALCGAESIDAEVLRAFVRRFAPLGLRPNALCPVYGLAEATLAVAFAEPNDDLVVDVIARDVFAAKACAERAPSGMARTQAVVSIGWAMPGHEVRVVSTTTGEPCAEREVGEIVVRGPSVSGGYWSEGGSPRTEGRERTLRTGDLGYVADGRLFVIDRLKDLIIVAGENHAPSDIEACVNEIEGVRPGGSIAFGTRDAVAGTEKLVVLSELDPRKKATPARLRVEIAARVKARCGLTPAVAVVVAGTIEKTTSGKVRRCACRDLYEAGLIEDLAAEPR